MFTRLATQIAASVAALVKGERENCTAADEFAHAFELAVSEAFTNSVTHAGQRSAPPSVTVIFLAEPKQLTVSICDTNAPFSIDTKAPDIESYPENGYGLLIIRKVMDKVTYRRESDMNIISMSKML